MEQFKTHPISITLKEADVNQMNKKDNSNTSIVFTTTRNAKQANLLLYKVIDVSHYLVTSSI